MGMAGTGGYWWVLVGTGGYWWVLAGTGGYWWVLVGTGAYWWVLVDTGGYRGVLAGTGGYWWVLVGTGGYWRGTCSGPMLSDVCGAHVVGRVRETNSGMQDPNKDVPLVLITSVGSGRVG